ncbi:MAG TPA: metallopeptidase TldD-related protein, partial [Myxococcota bacterium]|nr:metallopeptidase TldD-related protein [Myxococcota bacterium]
DFARFNHAQIRQAGTIDQQYIDLDLISGQKHANATIGLARDRDTDRQTIAHYVKKLREQLKQSQKDPFLMLNEAVHNTESVSSHSNLDAAAITHEILDLSAGFDLVGCYFGGPIYRGFANSFGQINWFEKSSFVVDTSIYYSGDQAIKQNYADISFNKESLEEKIESAKSGLSLFQQGCQKIPKGQYRVYFSPTAVYEILSLINWGGFSKKALEVKNSPLMPLRTGQKELSSAFSLSENIKDGLGPNFQSQGFMKQASLPIIEDGRLMNTLISPKTAKEYGLDHNGADVDETMCSMDMRPGDLSERDVLKTLGDGLYINNLWYLNFSDRQNGCLTGMTRFLCVVVKNGKPLAPFSVMRFDDSIYRLFGENLLHITSDRQMIIDTNTYDERATSCAILPGFIAENVRFTL